MLVFYLLNLPLESFARHTVASIQKKLSVQPLLTQVALGGEGKGLYGLVDLVRMEAHKWKLKDGNWGKTFSTIGEEEMKTSMYNTWEFAKQSRENLIEALTDFDSDLAEHVIETETFENVDKADLQAALRRVSLNPSSGALVTFLGSSYTNVGVQPLMNAIIEYCPSPIDNLNPDLKKFGNNFCGLVFKIVHHPMKGVLCFVRVYTGTVTNKDSIYNVKQKKSDKLRLSWAKLSKAGTEIGKIGWLLDES